MEAPKPIEINLGEEKLKEEKIFTINSENKIYNLDIINFNSFIKFYCFYLTEDNKYEFEKKYFLEELKSNKYLSICDSIDEVYSQLKIELDKNNVDIKENKEDIILKININHIKAKDISFKLDKKIKDIKETIEDLKDEISFLKKENKFLKASIEKLENQNTNINNNLINLNNDNKLLLEKISKLEKIVENNGQMNLMKIQNNEQMMRPQIMQSQNIFNNLATNQKGKLVIFRRSGLGSQGPPIMISFSGDEKVYELIQIYRKKSGDNDDTKKFVFNAKVININLTANELGLTDGCNIFVLKSK